jgi:hypothetical protein
MNGAGKNQGQIVCEDLYMMLKIKLILIKRIILLISKFKIRSSVYWDVWRPVEKDIYHVHACSYLQLAVPK